MRLTTLLAAGFALASSPAFAQDDTDPPAPVTVSGALTGVSDYRLRGVSQTDKHIAVQGALTIAHESGFYIAGFASNLAGWGTFGGANIELDGILGYKRSFGAATIDAGVTWYTYPGGFAESDVVEFFGKVSGTAGPATLTAGVFYAPEQTSISRFFRTGAEAGAGTSIDPKRFDNLYLTGDAAAAIPNTPVTVKAHIGWSKGNDGLGPNGTSLAPTGEYFDWLVGADVAVYKNLTLGVSYVDTDIGEADSAYLAPNFRESTDGSSISKGTVLVSLTAAF
jgi:uncharacterized protein (TIGR02001 family)